MWCNWGGSTHFRPSRFQTYFAACTAQPLAEGSWAGVKWGGVFASNKISRQRLGLSRCDRAIGCSRQIRFRGEVVSPLALGQVLRMHGKPCCKGLSARRQHLINREGDCGEAGGGDRVIPGEGLEVVGSIG